MREATLRSPATRDPRERATTTLPEPLEPFLGPAVVTGVEGSTVTVCLEPGLEVRALLALALPYAAVEGDVLLVIGRRELHYAIGVLSGRGKTEIALHGDVSLHAVGGTLKLSGDQGVTLRGPAIAVQADTLHTVARSVVETFSTLFQRVTEVLRVHAGESQTIVEGGAYTQAKTAAIQTEETVTVNGKEIHLG
jgi:hypothetical protein